MTGLKIAEYSVPVPVIQGGMGVGISLSGLAGSVAACGGVGIISTAQIGYREPDYDTDPLEANLRAVGKEIRKARRIAPQGVIGVNIMVATREYEAYVEAAVEAGADLVISGAGLPMTLPAAAAAGEERKKAAGGRAGYGSENGPKRAALAPIVSSRKAAEVICRYWKKKYRAVPDLLVVEGPLAGGHLGFSAEQLEDIPALHYEEEIRSILEFAAEYSKAAGKKIPVAVAGGIYDRADMDRALALGADAVQMATRFVTTWECDAADAYKQAYIRAKREDIVLTKSPVGMPGRAIRNAFLERAAKERIPHGRCHGCITSCRPGETPYCITEALIAAVHGDVENGLLFAGENAWKARKMEHVAEIMEELSRK